MLRLGDNVEFDSVCRGLDGFEEERILKVSLVCEGVVVYSRQKFRKFIVVEASLLMVFFKPSTGCSVALNVILSVLP